MQSFLYQAQSGKAIDVTFSGLAAGQAYSLYIYGQSDGNSPDFGGTVTVNGGAAQTALQKVDSTFVNGQNTLEFTGVANSSGDISIVDAIANGRNQTMINGIQLETGSAAPEPATLTLFGMGLAGMRAARRRRKA